ncbi:collagen alpha-1(I) chain-like isoform X3 [Manis pentadactyla]|uniref:collagen alpha-1(I) chain-like isoform X3 n=1 Tax=Manis pentadactyla TaxID=143292 RepID=UPI00255D0E73|nr:collagen alpha-1(I) chain-like isoform X3 [Manis pentadactyla]
MSTVPRGVGPVPPPHSAGKLNPASSTTACAVAGLAGRPVLPVLLTLSVLGRLTPAGPRERRSPLLGGPPGGRGCPASAQSRSPGSAGPDGRRAPLGPGRGVPPWPDPAPAGEGAHPLRRRWNITSASYRTTEDRDTHQ